MSDEPRRYGRLTAIGPPYPVRSRKRVRNYLPCRCDCGTEKSIAVDNLKSGSIKSCGCLHDEMAGVGPRTHGETKTRLFRIWMSMRNRCTRPNRPCAKNYLLRGISIDPAWEDFVPFRDWAIAHGYREELSIDRIDNDGDYGPDNCRWATRKEQNRNQRSNLLLTAFGETKAAAAWAEDPRCMVSYRTLRNRIYCGKWDHERAITEPVKPK